MAWNQGAAYGALPAANKIFPGSFWRAQVLVASCREGSRVPSASTVVLQAVVLRNNPIRWYVPGIRYIILIVVSAQTIVADIYIYIY